jgi:hypothetical protein
MEPTKSWTKGRAGGAGFIICGVVEKAVRNQKEHGYDRGD